MVPGAEAGGAVRDAAGHAQKNTRYSVEAAAAAAGLAVAAHDQPHLHPHPFQLYPNPQQRATQTPLQTQPSQTTQAQNGRRKNTNGSAPDQGQRARRALKDLTRSLERHAEMVYFDKGTKGFTSLLRNAGLRGMPRKRQRPDSDIDTSPSHTSSSALRPFSSSSSGTTMSNLNHPNAAIQSRGRSPPPTDQSQSPPTPPACTPPSLGPSSVLGGLEANGSNFSNNTNNDAQSKRKDGKKTKAEMGVLPADLEARLLLAQNSKLQTRPGDGHLAGLQEVPAAPASLFTWEDQRLGAVYTRARAVQVDSSLAELQGVVSTKYGPAVTPFAYVPRNNNSKQHHDQQNSQMRQVYGPSLESAAAVATSQTLTPQITAEKTQDQPVSEARTTTECSSQTKTAKAGRNASAPALQDLGYFENETVKHSERLVKLLEHEAVSIARGGLNSLDFGGWVGFKAKSASPATGMASLADGCHQGVESAMRSRKHTVILRDPEEDYDNDNDQDDDTDGGGNDGQTPRTATGAGGTPADAAGAASTGNRPPTTPGRENAEAAAAARKEEHDLAEVDAVRLIVGYDTDWISVPTNVVPEWEFAQLRPLTEFTALCEYAVLNVSDRAAVEAGTAHMKLLARRMGAQDKDANSRGSVNALSNRSSGDGKTSRDARPDNAGGISGSGASGVSALGGRNGLAARAGIGGSGITSNGNRRAGIVGRGQPGGANRRAAGRIPSRAQRENPTTGNSPTGASGPAQPIAPAQGPYRRNDLFFRHIATLFDVCSLGLMAQLKKDSEPLSLELNLDKLLERNVDSLMESLQAYTKSTRSFLIVFVVMPPRSDSYTLLAMDSLAQVLARLEKSVGIRSDGTTINGSDSDPSMPGFYSSSSSSSSSSPTTRIIFQLVPFELPSAALQRRSMLNICCGLYTKASLLRNDPKPAPIAMAQNPGPPCVHIGYCLDPSSGWLTACWTDKQGTFAHTSVSRTHASTPRGEALQTLMAETEKLLVQQHASVPSGEPVRLCISIVASTDTSLRGDLATWKETMNSFSQRYSQIQISMAVCRVTAGYVRVPDSVLAGLQACDVTCNGNDERSARTHLIVGRTPLQSNRSLLPLLEVEMCDGDLSADVVLRDLQALAALRIFGQQDSIVPIHLEISGRLSNWLSPIR